MNAARGRTPETSAEKVDYDAVAPGYDRRYAEHDYGGIERELELHASFGTRPAEAGAAA